MVSSDTWWSEIRQRATQGFESLLGRRDAISFPSTCDNAVGPEVIARWESRSAFDQHHMRDVASDLRAQGATEEVVLAGLLHDIGKPVRTSTLARTLLVVLDRVSPQLLETLVRVRVAFPGRDQLRSLVAHAVIGSTFLDRHGLPARVVWLVRHHHDAVSDEELQMLQAADDRH